MQTLRRIRDSREILHAVCAPIQRTSWHFPCTIIVSQPGRPYSSSLRAASTRNWIGSTFRFARAPFAHTSVVSRFFHASYRKKRDGFFLLEHFVKYRFFHTFVVCRHTNVVNLGSWVEIGWSRWIVPVQYQTVFTARSMVVARKYFMAMRSISYRNLYTDPLIRSMLVVRQRPCFRRR